MSELHCAERGGAFDLKIDPNWIVLKDNTYECRVLICPEADGGFSAHALRLPGVVSEGDTEVEALENIRDAFQAVIQSYKESSDSIPWRDAEIERPRGSTERWILVNV